MENRINIMKLQPNAYKAMFGLEKYLGETSLDNKIKALIKIRASQINGCAYCIQMHTEEVRKLGESEQRLYALSAWKESPLFSDKERAILALTDKVTLIAENGLSDEIYQKALKELDENEIAEVIMMIVTANAWNRIALSTAMRH